MKLPHFLAIAAALFLSFLGGIVVTTEGLPPSQAAKRIVAELKDLVINWRAYYADEPTLHLAPSVYPGSETVTAEPARMQPGVTLLTGLFGDRLGFRLVGPSGEIVHDWPIDFFQVAPEEMEHKFHALIHGTQLFPNGDIVANLDGRGMIRFDRCGAVLWQNASRTHHSIFLAEDGFLWAPMLADKISDPGFATEPFHFDTIGKFDPDSGELDEVIALYDVLERSERLALARRGQSNLDDITHTNDVEILGPDLASDFPIFAAGDIMVSNRHIDQIWVIDGQTKTLKWFFTGPMRGQHDPDFQPGGKITVFDNSGKPLAGGPRQSRILEIDPSNGNTRELFGGTPDQEFFTPYRGKHQMLANGNILATETDRGRAIEVDPDGRIVWSYVNRWDEDRVGWLMQAQRYPLAYLVNGAGCNGS